MIYDADIARKYDERSQKILLHDYSRILLRRILKPLPRDQLMIDVGCGSGLDLRIYRHLGFRRIIGVEPSVEMRRIACDRIGTGKVVRVLAGDWEHLPLRDGEVGILVSRHSLHYCQNTRRAFREVARVLRPGGMFVAVLSHPTCDALEKRDDKGFVTITLHGGEITITYPCHRISEYLGGDARKLFSLRGFYPYFAPERDGVQEYHPTNMMLVAQRRGGIVCG